MRILIDMMSNTINGAQAARKWNIKAGSGPRVLPEYAKVRNGFTGVDYGRRLGRM